MGTVRCRYEPLGSNLLPGTKGFAGNYLYTFWHDSILMPTFRYRHLRPRVRIMISQHRDGQLIAETAERLGYIAVRGSSTRGGLEAMRQLIQGSRESQIVVTPDGPRGPRRIMQPGPIYLASRAGVPIVALGVAYERAWRAKSWDRFEVPRPFTRAILVTTHPIVVPARVKPEEIEHYRMLVQEQMDQANERAQAIAENRLTQFAAAAGLIHLAF